MLPQKDNHGDGRDHHQQADENRKSSTKSHSGMGKNDSIRETQEKGASLHRRLNGRARARHWAIYAALAPQIPPVITFIIVPLKKKGLV
jgi:hypothetical protein